MAGLLLLTVSAAFAVAMGFLEAIVVVYIRHLLGMVPTPVDLKIEVVRQIPRWLINTERVREACTIVMLAALGWLAGRSRWERVGVFLWAFGIWDLTYYLGLYLFLRWPPSLTTIDCLFLIPVPWIAPVWLPMAAATLMAGAGAFFILRYGKRGD